MEEQNKKFKVLVSAYACEPHKGSEPGVGWNWVKRIEKFADAWVITRTNNREVIEEELQKNPVSNLHFIYVDLPRWMSFWKKGQRGIRAYYYLWQFAALKKASDYNRKIGFDVAHHITFVNDWLPSFLALLPIPFIWGPIGSNQPVPLSFLPNIRSKIKEVLRVTIQKTFRHFDPLFYVTVFKSIRIITINERLQKNYPFKLLPKKKLYTEMAIGINVEDVDVSSRIKDKKTLKVISVGRLIYIKGMHLTLEAFAKVLKTIKNVQLQIVGDGKERSTLEKLAQTLGIEGQVVFSGNISRADVLDEIVESDIFVLPSFEGAGMVFLEAMAAGLPLVCLDYGGAGEMVSDECGIKVKPKNPDQTVQELAEGLIKLASDPELRKSMGAASRKRVEEYFSWENKGEFIQKVYLEVLDSEGSSRT